MLSKKYSAMFKKEKVEEYLKECEINYVIGRKNFLFCKTESGANITSELYSIV